MLASFARRVAPRVVQQQRRFLQLQQRQRAAAFHSTGLAQQADEAPAAARVDTSLEFKWQHMLTPNTPADFTSGMRAIDTQLASMRQELSGVPDSIEPIDWSEWEAKIEDKAALEKIKSNYESFEPEKTKGINVEQLVQSVDARVRLTQRRADCSPTLACTRLTLTTALCLVCPVCVRQIKAMSSGKALLSELLTGWRAELEEAKREKEEVHNWKFHDYLNRYPGLAEEVREEWMQGYQLPNDALERLAETDLRELTRQLKSGQPVQLEPDIPLKVGVVSYENELLQVEQLARKLLGDQPELQPVMDRIKREREMFKQEPEHH